MTALPPLAGPRAAGRFSATVARRSLRARAAARARGPAWEAPMLAGLLSAALALYLWNLAEQGFANDYYAAAVQAGTRSWTAFLWGSLDAGNFITVDKPPLALWVMELSARVFGFGPWSMLVPEALMGVGTVWLTHLTVRRWRGPAAGLLAGAALALTPVAALMFRFDNPDAALTLLLAASAYALTRATAGGSVRWLAAAGALMGAAFLAKSLQAFLLLPALALVWMLAAPGGVGRRLGRLAAGAGAMVAAGGWWVALAELVPAGSRPYIGGSSDNSVLDLIIGYNGVDRLTGSGGGPGGGGGGGGFSGATGIGRLFDAQMGGQISWLLPFAALAVVVGLWRRRRRPRTDGVRAGYLLLGTWTLTHLLVFSFMSGIIHTYYTVAMAPAVAGLAGMGAVEMWGLRARRGGRWLLPAGVAATGAWAFVLLGRSAGFLPWLRPLVLVVALAAAAALLIDPRRLARRVSITAAAAAGTAMLAGPAAYALATVGRSIGGSTPSAGPTVAGARGFGGFGGFGRPGDRPAGAGGAARGGGADGPLPAASAAAAPARGAPGRLGAGQERVSATLVAYLEAHRGGATWIAATTGANAAAPLELASGDPVMAIGGFSGRDPAPTLARFIALVREGKVRYYLAGGFGGFAQFRGSAHTGEPGLDARPAAGADGGARRFGGLGGPRGGPSAAIATWARTHGKAVARGLTGGATVYDLSGAASG